MACYKKYNEKDKYYTTGQILKDYTEYLTEEIENIRAEKGPDYIIKILDPCAGKKSLDIPFDNVVYDLYDLEPENDDIKQLDFITGSPDDKKYDIVVCNPPFTQTKIFWEKCIKLSDKVIYISTSAKKFKFYKYKSSAQYNIDFAVAGQICLGVYDKNKINNTPDLYKYLTKPDKRFEDYIFILDEKTYNEMKSKDPDIGKRSVHFLSCCFPYIARRQKFVHLPATFKLFIDEPHFIAKTSNQYQKKDEPMKRIALICKNAETKKIVIEYLKKEYNNIAYEFFYAPRIGAMLKKAAIRLKDFEYIKPYILSEKEYWGTAKFMQRGYRNDI